MKVPFHLLVALLLTQLFAAAAASSGRDQDGGRKLRLQARAEGSSLQTAAKQSAASVTAGVQLTAAAVAAAVMAKPVWCSNAEAIQAAKEACKEGGRLLYVGLVSAPHNVERRSIARSKYLDAFRKVGLNDCIRMEFVIGHEPFRTGGQGSVATPEEMQLEKELEEEQESHKDILRVPVPESYLNLPDKTLALMSEAVIANYSFVAKIDDDRLPNLPAILSLIRGANPASFLYSGFFLWDKQLYPNQVGSDGKFVPYFAGPSYLLSRGLAQRVAIKDETRSAEFMAYGSSSEDIDMGRWVAQAEELSGKKVRRETVPLSFPLCDRKGCQASGYSSR